MKTIKDIEREIESFFCIADNKIELQEIDKNIYITLKPQIKYEYKNIEDKFGIFAKIKYNNSYVFALLGCYSERIIETRLRQVDIDSFIDELIDGSDYNRFVKNLKIKLAKGLDISPYYVMTGERQAIIPTTNQYTPA